MKIVASTAHRQPEDRYVAGLQAVHVTRQRSRSGRRCRYGRSVRRRRHRAGQGFDHPFIAAIVGKPDFSAIEFTVNSSRFLIGDLINAVVSFILIGAAVYFFIVLPVNKILARMRRGEAAPDPTTKKCPECLSDVPIAARRCAFCTSVLTEAAQR
jgi:large conductance mechanosensitive channel